MHFRLSSAPAHKTCLAAVVLLVGCSSAAAPTASPSSPTTTAAASAQTQTPPSPSAEPPQTPSPSATSGGGDDLASLFVALAPALSPFNAGTPVVVSGEVVIAQAQSSLDLFAGMASDSPGFNQDEIDRHQDEIDAYMENGLVERGSLSVGTTPRAGLIVYRFESDAGAAADFAARLPLCDDVTVPGTNTADVVAKSCNVPDSHNDVYLIAHRGDLVVMLQARDLPEDLPTDPVIATLAEVLRSIDPSLAR